MTKFKCTNCYTKKKSKKMYMCQGCECFYCKKCHIQQFNSKKRCIECNRNKKIQQTEKRIISLFKSVNELKKIMKQ